MSMSACVFKRDMIDSKLMRFRDAVLNRYYRQLIRNGTPATFPRRSLNLVDVQSFHRLFVKSIFPSVSSSE